MKTYQFPVPMLTGHRNISIDSSHLTTVRGAPRIKLYFYTRPKRVPCVVITRLDSFAHIYFHPHCLSVCLMSVGRAAHAIYVGREGSTYVELLVLSTNLDIYTLHDWLTDLRWSATSHIQDVFAVQRLKKNVLDIAQNRILSSTIKMQIGLH